MNEPSCSHQAMMRVAVAANASLSTVRKVIAGEPTRPSLRERVEAALRAEGLGHLIRAS